jgi:AsmA family protein
LAHRRVPLLILGFVGAVAAIGGVTLVLLLTIDFRPLIERYVSWSLDRRLAIGEFRIGWGNPIAVEIRDLRLANASWAAEPDMLRIESLSAEIDPWPLLRGVLRYRTLRTTKPIIILERDSAGTGNWKFAGQGTPSAHGMAIVPKNRTQFPSLLDFALSDGEVDYRTSSGAWLRLKFHDLAIHAADDDTPVTVTGDGTYNDIAARLTATAQSFAIMRDGAAPFGATSTLATASSNMSFAGTMMKPLDFDGVQGTLRIDARNLGGLLAIFGATQPANFPFLANGALTKDGDHWLLSGAAGKLADNNFAGTLMLDEGPRAHPDNISLALDFAELDLTKILAPQDVAGGFSLQLDKNPGANLDARIRARQIVYGAFRFADFAVTGRSSSGAVEVSALSFALAGGQVDAAASARSVAGGSRVTASAALSGADAGQLAIAFGAAPGQMAGRLDASADLAMTGAAWSDAVKASRGQAAIAMTKGRVARAMLEHASTDLRAFFRTSDGSAEVTCLFGLMTIQDGIGVIAPLKLRTPETVLTGGGALDFVHHRLDLTIKADASTSVTALQIPLRISGDLGSLRVLPAIGSSTALPETTRVPDAMPARQPALQQLAAGNSCLH